MRRRRNTTHHSPLTASSAFTLLEVILATSIIVTVSGIMYWFFFNSCETAERDTARARDVQLVRVLLDRITQELRQACGYATGYGAGVIGDKNAVSVNTVVLPDKGLMYPRSIADAPPVGQFDMQEVRYYVAWDEENLDDDGNPRALGLVRRVSKTFLRETRVEGDETKTEGEKEASVAVKEELYAPQIKFIEFKYFDGATWWDDWQITQGNALPQVIRVTLGFTPVLPEDLELDLVEDEFLKDEAEQKPLPADRYTTFVRLVEADTFFGSRLTREASAFSSSESGGI